MPLFLQSNVTRMLFIFFAQLHLMRLVMAETKEAWSVPSIDIHAQLQKTLPDLLQHIKNESLDAEMLLISEELANYDSKHAYTLLDEKNINKDARDLICLFNNYDADIARVMGINTQEIDITSYRTLDIQESFLSPSRIALHEIFVAASTSLRLNDEDQLIEAVKTIHGALLLHIDTAEKDLDTKLKYFLNHHPEVIEHRKNCHRKAMISAIPFSQALIKTYFNVDLLEKIENWKLWWNTAKIKELYAQLNASNLKMKEITDTYYNISCTHMRSIVHDGLNRLVSLVPELNFITEIPAPEDKETFSVHAGIGSGKSSTLPRVKRVAQNKGIDWQDIIKINTDLSKPLLINKSDPASNSTLSTQLTKAEASIINKKTHRRVEEMVEEKRSPHVLLDQVYLSEERIDVALKNGGQARVTVVSTDVCDAVQRSYQRGVETGRMEHTKEILMSHKNMVNELIRDLSKFRNKPIIVEIVDNNVPKGESPILIARIDLQRQNAFVFDEEKLNSFIKKTIINTKATSELDIYSNQSVITIENYLNPLQVDIKKSNHRSVRQLTHLGIFSKDLSLHTQEDNHIVARLSKDAACTRSSSTAMTFS